MRIYGILKWEFLMSVLHKVVKIHILFEFTWFLFVVKHSPLCGHRRVSTNQKYLPCQQEILNQRKFDGIICFTWHGIKMGGGKNEKKKLCLSLVTHVFYCVKIHNSFKEGIVCVWYKKSQFYGLSIPFVIL